MFSINDVVLVWTGGSHEVGVILRKYKKRGYRVYDVALERGSVFVQIRVDNKKSNTYIDSKMSKSIAPKIDTKLSAESFKNVLSDIE